MGDFKRAMQLLTKAAEQGNPEAQFYLGHIFAQGASGVPKDPRAAKKWWTKSAAQGQSEAKAALKDLKAGKFESSDKEQTQKKQTKDEDESEEVTLEDE